MQPQKNSQEITALQAEAADVGALFRQAREALNLSFEAVAKEIALRPSILQDLENNKFIQKNVPPMFVRGYVRSYAKFLRLPDESWQHIDFGGEIKNDLSKNSRRTKYVNHYASHNHWIGWISALVLIVAVTMTGLWWWENHQQDNADRDQLVQTFKENEQKENSVTTAESNAVEIPVAIQSIAPNEVVNADSIGENSSEKMTAPQVKNEQSVNPLQSQMLQGGNANAVETPIITESSPVATSGDFVIEVTGDSWISVKNKNRKTLAEKLYKAGEVLTFNGSENEPYSVTIGAPSNVKVSYKGNAYPLKVDGRVARFKLPQ